MAINTRVALYQPIERDAVTQHQMQRSEDDRRERAQRIKAAWLTYHGTFKDALKPTRTAAGQTFNDNVKINHARVIVDTGVDYLFGRGLEWQVDEDGDTPEQDYLDAVWRANKKAITLAKLAQSGAIVGHAFIKIEPPLPPQREYPRLVVLDGESVDVDYDADDCETVQQYTLQWTRKPQNGHVCTCRQLITPNGDPPQSWTMQDQMSVNNGGWTDCGPPVLWPHPFPPIVDCQNLVCAGEYYGISDLEPDLLALNNAINYLQSNGFRIHRFNAHPIRWAAGVSNIETLKADIDTILSLPSPDASLNILQWGGDLTSLRAMFLDLETALYQMARVPKVAAGKVEDVTALSGVALKMLFQPLIAKTQLKRETYGDMLEELNQRLLLMNGMQRQEDMHSVWPELLPVDPLIEAQALVAHRTMAIVSKETASTKAGYEWPMERERMQRESLNLPPDATAAEVEAAEQARETAQLAAAQAAAAQPAPTEPAMAPTPPQRPAQPAPPAGGPMTPPAR